MEVHRTKVSVTDGGFNGEVTYVSVDVKLFQPGTPVVVTIESVEEFEERRQREANLPLIVNRNV